MHQYLDSDGSGTCPICVSDTIGAERLQAATQWLQQTGLKGFLGEIGTGNNTQCVTALQGALCEMQQAGGTWLGALWWAAGPWWGDVSGFLCLCRGGGGGADGGCVGLAVLPEHRAPERGRDRCDPPGAQGVPVDGGLLFGYTYSHGAGFLLCYPGENIAVQNLSSRSVIFSSVQRVIGISSQVRYRKGCATSSGCVDGAIPLSCDDDSVETRPHR